MSKAKINITLNEDYKSFQELPRKSLKIKCIVIFFTLIIVVKK